MRRIVKFTTFIFGLISCIHADINDGLVAFYPFNGNTIDESGHGNDGTPFGGVEFNTEDRFGLESGAAYFDGIDDKIQISHNDAMWGENITISAWANMYDFNGTQSIFEAWNPAGY